MNYRLSVRSETHPVEDLRIPSESIMAHRPAGEPFSFVSPVRLTADQQYLLLSDSYSYQLLVNTCIGFTYSLKYFVSGIIANKEAVAPLGKVTVEARGCLRVVTDSNEGADSEVGCLC